MSPVLPVTAILIQGSPIIFSPMITRVFTPADIGTWGFISGLIALIGGVAALRLEVFIPIAESKDNAKALTQAACRYSLLTGAATLFIVAIFYLAAPAELANTGAAKLLWILPVAVSLTGILSAIQGLSLWSNQIQLVAWTRATHSISTIAAQLVFGLYLGGGQGLAQGALAGLMIAIFIVYSKNRTLFRLTLLSPPCGLTDISSASTGRAVTENLFLNLAVYGPIVIIAAFYNTTSAGLLLMLHILSQGPVAYAAHTYGTTFGAEARTAETTGRLADRALLFIASAFRFTLGPCILLLISGASILPLLLGATWTPMAFLCKWFAPLILFQSITAPLIIVLHIRHRSNASLALQGLNAFFRISLVVMCFNISSETSFIGYALGGACAYMIALGYIMRTLHIRMANMLSIIRNNIPQALFWMMTSLLLNQVSPLFLNN
jgi:lipopolysaccharide exporter